MNLQMGKCCEQPIAHALSIVPGSLQCVGSVAEPFGHFSTPALVAVEMQPSIACWRFHH